MSEKEGTVNGGRLRTVNDGKKGNALARRTCFALAITLLFFSAIKSFSFSHVRDCLLPNWNSGNLAPGPDASIEARVDWILTHNPLIGRFFIKTHAYGNSIECADCYLSSIVVMLFVFFGRWA